MKDRELLELAAKAAGYPFRGYSGDNPLLEEDQSQPEPRLACPVVWNPLTDDGDALRLAVKLGLNINVIIKDGTFVSRYETEPVIAEKNRDQDPYAATRRAIVRAAASIGEQM